MFLWLWRRLNTFDRWNRGLTYSSLLPIFLLILFFLLICSSTFCILNMKTFFRYKCYKYILPVCGPISHLLKVSDIIYHYSPCLLKFRDPYTQDFRQGFKCKWFILEFISGGKSEIRLLIRSFLSIKLPWKFNPTEELMNQCRKCALELSHPRSKQIKVFFKVLYTRAWDNSQG